MAEKKQEIEDMIRNEKQIGGEEFKAAKGEALEEERRSRRRSRSRDNDRRRDHDRRERQHRSDRERDR